MESPSKENKHNANVWGRLVLPEARSYTECEVMGNKLILAGSYQLSTCIMAEVPENIANIEHVRTLHMYTNVPSTHAPLKKNVKRKG